MPPGRSPSSLQMQCWLAFAVRLFLIFAVAAYSLTATVLASPSPVSESESADQVSDSDPRIAERDRLWNKTLQLASEGKSVDAIRVGRQVLAIEKTVFRDIHEDVAVTLQWLSQQHLVLQEMDNASLYASQYAHVTEQVHEKTHWQAASARWYEDYVQKLVTAPHETVRQMMAIEARYDQLLASEKYAEAADEIANLIPLEEVVLGMEHPFLANTYANQSECLLNADNYSQCEQASKQALTIRRKTFGDEHPETAMAAWLQGLSQFYADKHEAAKVTFHLARDIWHRVKDKESVAQVELHIGYVNTWLDEWRLASEAFHRSMLLYRELGDTENEAASLKQIMAMQDQVTWYTSYQVAEVPFLLLSVSETCSPRIALIADGLVRRNMWPLLGPRDTAVLNSERIRWTVAAGDTAGQIRALREQKKHLESRDVCHDLKYGIALRQLAGIIAEQNAGDSLSDEERVLWRSSAAWMFASGEPFAAADVCGILGHREWESGKIEDAISAAELAADFLDSAEASDTLIMKCRKAHHTIMLAGRLQNWGQIENARVHTMSVWNELASEEDLEYSGTKASIAWHLVDIAGLQGNGGQVKQWQDELGQQLAASERLLEELSAGQRPLPSDADEAMPMVNALQSLQHFPDAEPNVELDGHYHRTVRIASILRDVSNVVASRPELGFIEGACRGTRQACWLRLALAALRDAQRTGFYPSWYEDVKTRLETLNASVDAQTLIANNSEAIVEFGELLVEMLHPESGVTGLDAKKSHRLSQLSTRLLQDPMLGQQPSIRPMLILSQAFGPFADENWANALTYCDQAIASANEYLARAGGDPRQITEVSSSMRSNIDPFSFGQTVASAADDIPKALEYALGGRGFGARAAFRAAGRDLPDTTLESIQGTLHGDECLLLISTTSTIGANSDVRVYVIRSSSSSKPSVECYLCHESSLFAGTSQGVLITDVVPNSTAATAGLRPLDIIESYGGQQATPTNLKNLIAARQEDFDVSVKVVREGQNVSLTVGRAAQLGAHYQSGTPEEVWRDIRLDAPAKFAESNSRLLDHASRGGAGLRGATIVRYEGIEQVTWTHGQSYHLFRSLFPSELWDELKSCQRVYVSLPAELAGLPLEVLTVEPPDLRRPQVTRWIDVGPPLVYLPAGRLVAQSAESHESPSEPRYDFVGLGGADFTAFKNMPQLPGTIREVTESASLVGEKRSLMLLREDATESRLRSSVESARVVLVGTHGVPESGEKILESALLMTPTETTDGRLTLIELLSNWPQVMSQTETTILSACQTNSNLVRHDENSLGLPFGFLVAGSKSVIASQWPVDDEATALLFAEFFRQTKSGKSSLDALASAKRMLRAKSQFSHPYYWAPFIFVSETPVAR